MPAIGPPLRTWTLVWLVCSIPPSALAQGVNETGTYISGPTPSPSTTTIPPASSSTSTRRYLQTGSTCQFRVINYITHTLPQQCARTTWSAPGGTASADANAITVEPPDGTLAWLPGSGEIDIGDFAQGDGRASASALPPHLTTSEGKANNPDVNAESYEELEADSPFDNANFLSFEEWKKRNLAQVGQSPENLGPGRTSPSNQAGRRRPVNVNALDSLGDEGEIEIDFGGFGSPPEGGRLHGRAKVEHHDMAPSKAVEDEGKIAPSSWALSKDAGKTCKERFNYASFDCAATVLKTNKQAKSSTSVLVENKDSYMLNECSADNKFIIVELCDDILVDTIVLANYEFFSSMFRHFRVSVSDRYPVKMERWRTLGTFEARNTRDIQPFLVAEPQIWARYIRIEFLTQFGNEFYCPLSLLRVHGTTMMEQFRREEEEARGLDEEDSELEAVGSIVVDTSSDTESLSSHQLSGQLEGTEQIEETFVATSSIADSTAYGFNESVYASQREQTVSTIGSINGHNAETDRPDHFASKEANSALVESTILLPVTLKNSTQIGLLHNISDPNIGRASSVSAYRTPTAIVPHIPSSSVSPLSLLSAALTSPSYPSSSVVTTLPSSSSSSSPPSSLSLSSVSFQDPEMTNAGKSFVSSSITTKAATRTLSDNTIVHGSGPPPRGTSTQPGNSAPSTQESFYKSIHKRLLHLEANSTLSLQYIEEQSRILRDAFIKVEKRQLAKTEKFLDHLNSTVMQELKSYRNMYDQLWQSTIIELESMKERQNAEIGEIGTRLSLMADELVWQKRMAVVQSTLLLLCLGLVLFVRSGTLGSSSDAPIVQHLGSRYNSFFESSPPRSPASTSMTRRRRTFRSMWRSDTSVGLSDHPSDGQQAMSDTEAEAIRCEIRTDRNSHFPNTPLIDPPTPTLDDQAARIQVLETQSGPATPNGTRDSRPSWEEVDRAIDQLKAEEQGLVQLTSPKEDWARKKKRSPLRRAHSSYESMGNDPLSDEAAISILDQ